MWWMLSTLCINLFDEAFDRYKDSNLLFNVEFKNMINAYPGEGVEAITTVFPQELKRILDRSL